MFINAPPSQDLKRNIIKLYHSYEWKLHVNLNKVFIFGEGGGGGGKQYVNKSTSQHETEKSI